MGIIKMCQNQNLNMGGVSRKFYVWGEKSAGLKETPALYVHVVTARRSSRLVETRPSCYGTIRMLKFQTCLPRWRTDVWIWSLRDGTLESLWNRLKTHVKFYHLLDILEQYGLERNIGWPWILRPYFYYGELREDRENRWRWFDDAYSAGRCFLINLSLISFQSPIRYQSKFLWTIVMLKYNRLINLS